MSISNSAFNSAFAGFVRGQAKLAAGKNQLISRQEEGQLAAPFAELFGLARRPGHSLTVDQTVSRVMAEKKKAMAALGLSAKPELDYGDFYAISKKQGAVETLIFHLAWAENGIEKFQSLPEDQQIEILVSGDTTVQEGIWAQVGDPKELRDPRLRAFAERILAAAVAEMPDLDDAQDRIVVIGDPQPTISVLYSATGEVLGGSVQFRQAGGAFRRDPPQDTETWYADAAAAKAAGVDVNADVSWMFGSLPFAKDGKLYQDAFESYWEWTGW